MGLLAHCARNRTDKANDECVRTTSVDRSRTQTLVEILVALLITIAVLFGTYQDKLLFKTLEIEGVVVQEGFTCSESCASDFWMGFFKFSVFLITLPLHAVPVLGTLGSMISLAPQP